MPDTIHDEIRRDRARQMKHWRSIARYRKYAEGDQPTALSPKQKEILKGILNEEDPYCDNVCHQIVAEARDRIEFQGWQCEDTKVNDWLSDLYSTARLKYLSGEMHYDTLRDGDHAVALSFNNDKNCVEITPEPWWDGSEGVFIAYTPQRIMKYAVKDWSEPDEQDPTQIVWRRVAYFEDRIERYISRAASPSNPAVTSMAAPGAGSNAEQWERYRLPSEIENGVPWPAPWRKRDGKPLGIQIVHFPNSGRGTGQYGTSELAGGVTGTQDQLNSLQWDMSGASRQTAFPIYTATGVSDDSVFVVGAGQVWRTPSKEAQFGQISAGDMSQIIATFVHKATCLARRTRTPEHAITGVWPSGEALMRAEQPAIGKATSQIERLNDAYVEVAHRATEIWNAYGKGEPGTLQEDVKQAKITAKFADAARRDPLSQSMVIANLADKISKQYALRMMGLSDEEIDQISKEQDEAQQKALELAQTAFSRGIGPGTQLPGKGPQPGQPGQPPKPGAQGGAGPPKPKPPTLPTVK